jgi:hypothetical protein
MDQSAFRRDDRVAVIIGGTGVLVHDISVANAVSFFGFPAETARPR